ncbi:MAG: hypothetical protein ACI8QQ_002003, partial [Psychroserpens sp.]
GIGLVPSKLIIGIGGNNVNVKRTYRFVICTIGNFERLFI